MRRLLAAAMTCIVVFSLSGQEAKTLPLSKQGYQGLVKTKASYLNNILKPRLQEAISVVDIEDGLQILKNQPSIGNATYSIDTLDQSIHVTYHIKERTTTLPLIDLGVITDNVWFLLGFTDNNFRGVGDSFHAYYQNNQGRHSGQVYFRKPRTLNSDWGYSMLLNKWSSVEPVFFAEGTVSYFYDNNGVSASIIRNINLNNQVELGGTYFLESYEKAPDQVLDNPPGPSDFSIAKYLTKLEFKQQFVNYHLFYLKGFETYINYQNVLNIPIQTWFNSVLFQSKLFLRPQDKLNVGMRLTLGISTNEQSPFAPFVADSHVNIRGIGNRIDRGTAQAVFNLEGRYTIYHKAAWSSQVVAFADSGTWRKPGGDLRDMFDSSNFRQFVGLGFRVNYQHIFGGTLRVDYGIDLFDPEQRGFVFGLGQYF